MMKIWQPEEGLAFFWTLIHMFGYVTEHYERGRVSKAVNLRNG